MRRCASRHLWHTQSAILVSAIKSVLGPFNPGLRGISSPLPAIHAQPDTKSTRSLHRRVPYSVCGTTVYLSIGIGASHRGLRIWTCNRAEDFRHANSPIRLSSNSNASTRLRPGQLSAPTSPDPYSTSAAPTTHLHGVVSLVLPVRVAVAILTGGIRPVTPPLCRDSARRFSPLSAL